ncbi:DUF2799 domain-containing protein [Photobacterium chitinilyticum]|uniref:DUF2799 domain-containing protein n=1 Tax=Photobacterium chitinilyticum TaxID=2485123 RepID=A0A3S3R2T2_9GAMM|nr:DUF2799 domain-containing protein [Photobacterium chitinilyticum]RWX56908.1 DUF2799 domain-containing protein [Photobacterium chitinilyticum]
MRKLALSILVIAQMAGCSSMSVEECKTADWQAVGTIDGQNGVPASRVNDYSEDCKEAGVRVDQPAWYAGYDLGLSYYCVPDNGYRIGRSGRAYYGVCDSPVFIEQYNQGQREYRVEKRIMKIDNELVSIDRELKRLEKHANNNSDEAKRLRRRDAALRAERRSLMVPTIQYHFTF